MKPRQKTTTNAPCPSPLCKRIVQSLRQSKKKMLTIQFQFVNMCIVKTCVFGQEICDTWNPCCNEKNVKVFVQTLNVTELTTCVPQYLSPKKANLKNIKRL
jgi:hypothetical protein